MARLELVSNGGSPDMSGKTGQIAAEMERRLVLGDYHFGEPLSVTQLACQFDVSRQPVTAAIAHLRSLGYVEIIPQVGCRVVSPSASDVADFFVALGKLEATAASFAARRYQDNEAEKLIAVADAREPATLNTQAERQAYIDSIFDYHVHLWAMSRSPALEARVSNLRRLATFYLWQGTPRMLPTTAHLLIMERIDVARAIMARDAVRAEILMEKHITHKPYISGVL